MFAIIQTGGKQYRVQSGDVIKVEKLAGAAGDSFVFDQILGHFDGGNTELSADKLGQARVGAEILEQTKTDKVIVFKKKRRHNYRRKNGHRQQITVLRIGDIALDGKLSNEPKAAKAPKAAPAMSDETAAAPKKSASQPASDKPAAKGAGNAGATAKPATKKPAAPKAAKTEE